MRTVRLFPVNDKSANNLRFFIYFFIVVVVVLLLVVLFCFLLLLLLFWGEVCVFVVFLGFFVLFVCLFFAQRLNKMRSVFGCFCCCCCFVGHNCNILLVSAQL